MRFLVCRWEAGSVEALLATGAKVVLLLDEWEAANRHIDPAVAERLERLITIGSFEAMDELATLATSLQLEGTVFDKVVSTCERGQFGAAYLATLLGLEQPTIVQSVRVRDKRAMKSAVASAGVRAARFTTVPSGDPGTATRHVAQEIGFPAVVKPVAGMGTTSTARVDTAEELALWLAENSDAGTLMAEQLIRGDEFHVDAVWVDGELWEIGVSRYLRPRIEVDKPGHLNGAILLPRAEEGELYAAVEELHHRVNEALEITDGITHTELFRSADGTLWFSELATRPGGGGVTQAFRPLGADLREIWAESLTHRRRDSVALHEPPFRYVGWLLLTPESAGRITREPSDEAIGAFPCVLEVERLRRVGETIQVSSVTAALLLVIGADSEDEFVARAVELESALVYETTPVE
ncbi:acetyl-CoA carboxylase biotin carboxylase subunit family protein [Kitasatospora sp. NPDC056138]|uniref:ATP-grasp domain-containing protein n=1 Tax=Kitasatospora sp. NPDC056138 TaxID=3345724 RepID=UPI0035DD8BC1